MLLVGLYFLTGLILIWYILTNGERRFGKFIWLGWVVLAIGVNITAEVTPDLPSLSFWTDVVWAYGAIALISRTIYSAKARTYGTNYKYITSMATVLRTNFSSPSDFNSGMDWLKKAASEGQSNCSEG